MRNIQNIKLNFKNILPQFQKNNFTICIYLEMIKYNTDTMIIKLLRNIVDSVVKWFMRTANNQSPHSPGAYSSIDKKIFLYITKIIG